jgi:hypothetical protein
MISVIVASVKSVTSWVMNGFVFMIICFSMLERRKNFKY